MKATTLFFSLVLFSTLVYAQESQAEVDTDVDIVEIIDELTIQWDTQAAYLSTYEGLMEYCRNKVYRDNTLELLNKIHHYDTSLYMIVQAKYNENEDAEAKATLDDIEKLEIDYTTKSFLVFLRQECVTLNDIEKNKTSGTYSKEVKHLEKELAKYVNEITEQVDLIDEHVHHLDAL